jgi:cytochrome P450
MSASDGQDFDPLIPESFDSPYPVYAQLRAQCPVAHSNAWGGFWGLATYQDVLRVLAEPDVFITSRQNVVPKLAFTGRRPPLHLDPPEHTPYRRALNPLLKPERIAALEPAIRRTAASLLVPLVERGGGDICVDYSSHLTIRVFAEWMNVPEELVPNLQQVGRAYNIAVQSADGEMVRETSLKLYDLARTMIESRRREPRDPATDPTAALLAARVDGQPFADEMILGTIRQVLVVGIIAPTVVVGSMCVHLARHPQLQQQLPTVRCCRAQSRSCCGSTRLIVGSHVPPIAMSNFAAVPFAKVNPSPCSTPRQTAMRPCSRTPINSC